MMLKVAKVVFLCIFLVLATYILTHIRSSTVVYDGVVNVDNTAYVPFRIHGDTSGKPDSLPVNISNLPVDVPISTGPISAQPNKAIFIDEFNNTFQIKETGSMVTSKNTNWWLSSGAYFYSNKGIGSTIKGALSTDDERHKAYLKSNPRDTDDGYYPQNIFRLVLRSKWHDFKQEAYFRVTGDHLSHSPYRNSSNGVLFFNRYQDAFNLYYTGIRVDGHVTIKKKVKDVYYTLAYEPFITSSKYDRDTNPNLLPKNTWIGIRSEVKNNIDGTVNIKFYVDSGKTGNWILAAEATDDGKSYGGAPILNNGYAGLRTDFMDVEFDSYKIEEQ